LVASRLQESGLATLLLDLLTPDEERADALTGEYRFDVALLGSRLTLAADYLHARFAIGDGSVGCFGASTGAAAALITAADRPQLVGAVVSRGGRPDLAGSAVLSRVHSPTLLIVGGGDPLVLELNEAAQARLGGERLLEIVPSATHLFEEPGALEIVASLAAGWFEQHLVRTPLSQPGL
jgi:pimeloyl-ACP methyl ester carboxylesterase